MTTIPDELRAVVALRARTKVDELDYRRALVAATKRFTQAEVARAAGIRQPSLSSALKTAEKVAPVPEGFSGASPMEICQRYAAGLITRAQVIDELARWNYVPRAKSDGYDWLAVNDPGTFADVEEAADTGLIDDEIYDAVVERQIA